MKKKSKGIKGLLSNKIFWLSIIIILLGLYQIYSINNPIEEPSEPYNTMIKDNCGKTLNDAVLHTIDDDTKCSIECRNLCRSLEKEYNNHDFTEMAQGCHDCYCECK